MFNYEAAKAAAEQRSKEQTEAFHAVLNAHREQAQKQQAAAADALKGLMAEKAEKRRQEAERQAEKAAEDAKQAVLDKYEKETGKDPVTEGYRKLAKSLFPAGEK